MGRRWVWPVRVAVLAAALACIVLGVVRQEHLVVWQKAVNVCLECIGLG